MASVNVYTAEHTDDVFNQDIVSGTVVGDNLILSKRDGSTVNAGNVRGPQGTAGSTLFKWSDVTAYTTGAIVGYAGGAYKALANSTNKPPALFGSLWTCLTPPSPFVVCSDPNFDSDIIGPNWNAFWGTGTHAAALSTTAGDFETGKRGLKITLSASSSKRIYPQDETILASGGQYVQMRVRAKVLTGTGVTLTGAMSYNDETGIPEPFGTGAGASGQTEAAQPLTTSWAWYWLSFPTVAGKPRNTVAAIINTGAGSAATVAIDRVEFYVRSSVFLCDTNWIALPMVAGWANYPGAFANGRYNRINGYVNVEGLIQRTGVNVAALSVFAILPAGFRPINGKVFGTVVNSAGTESWGGVFVVNSGDMSVSTHPINTSGYTYLNTVRFEAVA